MVWLEFVTNERMARVLVLLWRHDHESPAWQDEGEMFRQRIAAWFQLWTGEEHVAEAFHSAEARFGRGVHLNDVHPSYPGCGISIHGLGACIRLRRGRCIPPNSLFNAVSPILIGLKCRDNLIARSGRISMLHTFALYLNERAQHRTSIKLHCAWPWDHAPAKPIW